MLFLYRINGGEILGVSIDPNAWDMINTTYYNTVTDPPTPDGVDLGVKKIFDAPNVRNATAGEIANFPIAAATDENLVARNSANTGLDASATSNFKLFRAEALLVIDEINALRQWTVSFKAEVAAATSLANLQTRVASLPTLNDRTGAQALTAIKNKISNGDVD